MAGRSADHRRFLGRVAGECVQPRVVQVEAAHDDDRLQVGLERVDRQCSDATELAFQGRSYFAVEAAELGAIGPSWGRGWVGAECV